MKSLPYSLAYYIQKWGNSASIALFNPSSNMFFEPSLDGIIGYRLEAGCAIVFGDPICSAQDMPHLTEAFHDHCKKNNTTVIYTITSEYFTNWALTHGFCRCAAAIGDEIILNPLCDPKAFKGKNGSSLRNKYTYSLKQGIAVFEYIENDQSIEQALDEVRRKWLEHRKGPQVCFFSHISLFDDRSNKRYFYAEYKNTIVAVAILNRLDNHQGWVLNMLMKNPDAPTTTSEFLIMSILDRLREEACQFFSIGTTPAPELGRTEGFGRFYTWIMRNSFKVINKIFKLDKRQRYWDKFNPKIAPTFIMCNKSKIGIREALGIARAYNAPI